jgi:hypothetical protein
MERSLETRLEGASTTLTWNSVLWVNETGARWMLQWSVDDERCAFFAIWDLQKSLLGHVTTDQSPFDNQRKYTKQTPLLVHDKDLSFLLLLKHLWLLPAVEIPVEKSFTLARQCKLNNYWEFEWKTDGCMHDCSLTFLHFPTPLRMSQISSWHDIELDWVLGTT